MKYAVIQTGGKQYKVGEGAIVDVEKLQAEPGSNFTFDSILFFADDDSMKVGTPTVDGATVTAKVIEQRKDKKIRVAKFKAKSRYRRVTGHRQQLTRIQIEKIEAAKDSKALKDKESAEVKDQKSKVKTTTKKSKV